jgi:hypothetical protein
VNTTTNGTVSEPTAGTDEWLTGNKLDRADFVSGGSSSDSIATGVAGTYDATPLQILNRMARKLDENNVPKEDRWFVGDPVFYEKLRDEDSKLLHGDWDSNKNGDILTNGKVTGMKLRGFTLYESQNLPYIGTGPGTVDTNGSSSHYGVICAGHRSAVATAEQMAKTESMRSSDSFGDVVRGMHLYGRKILRSESLVRAIYNINA